MTKKPIFSFYGTHAGQSTVVNDILHSCALKNARLAIGIDLIYYKPQGPKRQNPIKSLFIKSSHLVTYFIWWTRLFFRGRLIIPTTLIVSLSRFFYWFFAPKDSSLLLVVKGQSPDDHLGRVCDEQIATYIRFVSTTAEEFGLNQIDPSKLRDFYYKTKVYRSLLNILYFVPVKAYFTAYSSYLHSFLPCKVALKNSVPVIVFGTHDSLFRCSQTEVPKSFDWPENSSSLSVEIQRTNESLAQLGQSILSDRINGQLDKLVGYMEVSAYSKSPTSLGKLGLSRGNFLVKDTQNSIAPFLVIYMHEFYDYHHNGVLPKFASSYYEWLKTTLSIVHYHRINYCLKVHPAIVSNPKRYQQSLNSLSFLAHQFSDPIVLSINETTEDLVKKGMTIGCTVRGTVALELIFQMIPVVCSGSPPYKNFLPRRCIDDLNLYTNILTNHFNVLPVTDDEIYSACKYTGLIHQSLENCDESSFNVIQKNNINLPSFKQIAALKANL